MTDRELLEASARASEMSLHYWRNIDNEYEWITTNGLIIKWNPLADDGDALRLAVKLSFMVVIQPHETEVFHPDGGCLASEHVFSFPTESYAATHRAITRAAAEIGKNMTSA